MSRPPPSMLLNAIVGMPGTSMRPVLAWLPSERNTCDPDTPSTRPRKFLTLDQSKLNSRSGPVVDPMTIRTPGVTAVNGLSKSVTGESTPGSGTPAMRTSPLPASSASIASPLSRIRLSPASARTAATLCATV